MAAEGRCVSTNTQGGLTSRVSACDRPSSSGTALCKSFLGTQAVLLQRSKYTGYSETGTGTETETGSGLDSAAGHLTDWMCNMTFEDTAGDSSTERYVSGSFGGVYFILFFAY